MKFIVNSQVLNKTLQAVGGVITSNNKALPILSNFLFSIQGNKLTVVGSDLETTLVSEIELSEVYEEGTMVIPSKIILDFLKNVGDLPLLFTINLNDCLIEISAGEGKYRMVGDKADAFPEIPQITDTTQTKLSSSVLRSAIQKTLFATAQEDIRLVMAGVFFELSPDGLSFVATDAHKLVRYRRSDAKSDLETSFIIHKKPLNVIKNVLLGLKDDVEVELFLSKDNAIFTFENMRIICRLIDGKYPNYKGVIPPENPNKLTVDRLLLLNAMRRVALFSEQSIPSARLKVDGKELNISAEDRECANEAKERITCSFSGEPMEIGFNTKYIIEMLNILESDEVQIEMSHPARPGIITPIGNEVEGEDVLMLVMPIMLTD